MGHVDDDIAKALPVTPDSTEVAGGVELGATALHQTGGYVTEEWLRQLQGTRGVRTYREMRDNDPTIGAVLYAIESMILQASWTIEVPTEDPTEGQVAWRDFVDGALFSDMQHTWPEMLGDILTFMPYGWALLETVYKRRNGEGGTPESRFNDGRIGWRKFGIRSQDSLQRWEFDDNGDVRGMYQNNFYTTAPDKSYVYIPIEKAVLFTFRSWRNSPEGRSALRNAYRPWYFLKRLQEIEAVGIERELVGLPKIEAPPEIMSTEAGPKQRAIRNNLFKIVKNIRANSQAGIVFPSEVRSDGKPSGYKFSLVSSGGKRAIDPDTAIQRYKKEIAMTLLAQFLFLGMDSTGSFALAETDTDLFAVALGATMDRITERMNRDAIPRLMRLNGVPQSDWPVMQHGDIESRDITVLASYVSTLIGSGAISSDGLEGKLREFAGLPPREAPEAGVEETPSEATIPTGIQISTAAGIAEKVKTGLLAESQGIALLQTFYSMTEEQAKRIVSGAAPALPATPDLATPEPGEVKVTQAAGEVFRTGLGGHRPHSHTFVDGATETEPAGAHPHTHQIQPGAADTEVGGPDSHTHQLPRFAQQG